MGALGFSNALFFVQSDHTKNTLSGGQTDSKVYNRKLVKNNPVAQSRW